MTTTDFSAFRGTKIAHFAKIVKVFAADPAHHDEDAKNRSGFFRRKIGYLRRFTCVFPYVEPRNPHGRLIFSDGCIQTFVDLMRKISENSSSECFRLDFADAAPSPSVSPAVNAPALRVLTPITPTAATAGPAADTFSLFFAKFKPAKWVDVLKDNNIPRSNAKKCSIEDRFTPEELTLLTDNERRQQELIEYIKREAREFSEAHRGAALTFYIDSRLQKNVADDRFVSLLAELRALGNVKLIIPTRGFQIEEITDI